ncbi:MAG: TonB-dependent receptor [Lewinellaceae bacterium]|nr:TonB-dependent receptor [Lewinellaceae bacterium]
MKLKFLLLSVLLSCLSATAFAQFTVRGTVTSDEGEALIGATVIVKGTSTGTVTDIDGSFSIQVPGQQGVLEISYTGYESKSYNVSPSNNNIAASLSVSSSVLSEVVVVGYGETRREAITGSVTSLRSDKLEQVPLASVEQTLQGNIAGLQAVTGNGQPGANVQVRIRGIGSISASSEPLYVIDGIPVTAGDITRSNTTANTMASLNPNDIESVTVLKDAAATSIYGSRGSNGVILITTKSGRAGKPKIDVRTQTGWNTWAISEDRRLKPLTSQQYTEMYLEGWMNRGETLTRAIQRFNGHYPGAVTFGANGEIQQINVESNWIDAISRTGANQSYDVSVSGGNNTVTYFASGSYFSQDAPVIYSGLDRYSSRLNLAVTPSEKFKITNNLTVSYLDQFGMSDGSFWANPLYTGYFLAPTIPIYDDQGRFYGDHQSFFMGGNNPVGSLSGDDERKFNQTRIMDNLSAEYEILKGLKFRSAWAFDLINVQEFFYRNPRYGDGRNNGGFATETAINELNWIGTQTLNYNTTFAEKHGFGALVGYEAQKNRRKGVVASGEGYPDPTLRTLASAATPTTASSDLTEYSFESIFARLDYNFDSRYFLSGSIRNDGSSRFGVNNRFGTFWSVGGSWRISREDFFQNIKGIDELKLRASYGTNGNAGIGNYEHWKLFGFGSDYDGVPGGAPSNVGNPNLTWESTTAFNVGLDFGLFRNISGTIEYFTRESDNLLLDRPISATTGFTDLTQNFGAMRNSGIELTLNADIINKSNFTWSLGGNITFLKNEITRLDEDIIDGTKIRRQGYDFQSYYLFEWAGVDAQTGTPRWYTDETKSELTGNVNEIERFISGRSATPDFFGGFNTSVSFKNAITLDAQFVYSFGFYLYDTEARFLQGDGSLTPRSQTNLVLDRWKQPGDVTDVPYFRWGGNNNSNLANMTRWLKDGSHIRLRNLTLAYNLPTSLLEKGKLRSARIYLRGTNLFTWTKDKTLYMDPEAAINGLVSSPVPNLKNISVGLDIGF